MGHSSLLGSDEIPIVPPGHDTRSLGPSDTSDSGSDLSGIADHDEGDPGLPVDVEAEAERERSVTSAEDIEAGSDSDAGGTGERRSAGGDAGVREASDIGPDDIVPRPDSDVDDVDVDDDSPIFEDYPEVEDADLDLPDDSDSKDYGNAVFSGEQRAPQTAKRPGKRKPAKT